MWSESEDKIMEVGLVGVMGGAITRSPERSNEILVKSVEKYKSLGDGSRGQRSLVICFNLTPWS